MKRAIAHRISRVFSISIASPCSQSTCSETLFKYMFKITV